MANTYESDAYTNELLLNGESDFGQFVIIQVTIPANGRMDVANPPTSRQLFEPVRR